MCRYYHVHRGDALLQRGRLAGPPGPHRGRSTEAQRPGRGLCVASARLSAMDATAKLKANTESAEDALLDAFAPPGGGAPVSTMAATGHAQAAISVARDCF